MLVQGQSSLAKRGGLAADDSSRLIFLKKKKIGLENPVSSRQALSDTASVRGWCKKTWQGSTLLNTGSLGVVIESIALRRKIT